MTSTNHALPQDHFQRIPYEPANDGRVEMRHLDHYLVDRRGGLTGVVGRLVAWIRRTVLDERTEEALT